MLAWGAAYVPSAWLVETWPPLSAAGARLGIAGLVLLGALVATRQPLRPRVGLATVGWLALTQSMLFYGATFWGILHAGAGLAAVLANTDPLFVAALASVVLGEYLTRRQWLGLVVGLVGATVVVWQGPIWPPTLSGAALIVVGGAFAWSVGTVVATRGMRADANPVALAAWQMVLGGVALLVIGFVGEEGLPPLGAREVALILGVAIVGGAIPFALFYLALARAPATQVSTWFFLIPVVGVLSAWALLGEQPTLKLVVGLAAVSVGLWLVLAARAPGKELLVDSTPPL
jgi:drug/metabolite transporter (DMT)-like permease